jgi:hypothetical protein
MTQVKYSVEEYCEALWYPSPKSSSVLGKRVATAYRNAGLGEPETDERLVRGRLIPVKVYDCPNQVVENAIHKYYDEV